MNTKTGVSIIVPTHNSAPLLDRLLSTFLKTNTCQPVEILVIDNASTDHTETVIDQYATQVFIRLIQSNDAYPVSRIFDHAIPKAGYANLLFLSTGIVYHFDLVSDSIIKLHDNGFGAIGIPAGHMPNGDAADIAAAFLLCRKADYNTDTGFRIDGVKNTTDDCWQFEIQLGKKPCWIDNMALQPEEGPFLTKTHIHVRQNLPANSPITQIGDISRNKPLVQTDSDFATDTDIVICVHNAQHDLALCLDSVVRNTSKPYRMILVNDGSDENTTEYLRRFVHQNPQSVLLENQIARGYTRAANQGLKTSTAGHVVLLNSDTIVPRMWLEALTECARSDAAIGIVGPLSNAASWQSVPVRFGAGGDWAVNELPDGYSVDDMAELVYQVSSKRFPRVAFVNGFCFLIKRSLIDAIGLLDEDAFPAGYGEENDYCLRAEKAGFSLAIADHCYVYHAKSKSYSHVRRIKLSRKGAKALEKKHGSKMITRGTQALKNQADLAALRQRIQDYLKGSQIVTAQTKPLVIRFVLPASGIGGGILSVVQEACGMSRLGHDVSILTSARYAENYARFFPDLVPETTIFTFYENDPDFWAKAARADVLIATTWDSPRLIEPVIKEHPQILPAYYVQDYEPWFFPKNPDKQQIASASYTLIPDMLLMAKTGWMCQTVHRLQGVPVEKVAPGLDKTVFYPPADHEAQQKKPIGIVAMIRPKSPRRGAARTMRVLKKIQNRFDSVVTIHLFGCTDEEILPLEHGFSYQNHGVLKREDVATLYRKSALFVDFSDYQAFGRTGLEAMACGCVPILPSEGGVLEYAQHQKNALIVDTRNEEELIEGLASLVVSDSLRQDMRKAALTKSVQFNVERAVLSELGIIRQALQKHLNRSCKFTEIRSDRCGNPEKLKIALLLALRADGNPCGSSHIRLINPLSHPSVADRVMVQMVTAVNLFDLHPDILVIQRAAVPSPNTAQLIISHCRAESIRLVLEIDDDLLNLHQKTGNDVRYAGKNIEALKMIAKSADTVVVSSPPLADAMRVLNPHVTCVPNVHDERIWLEKGNEGFIRPQKMPDKWIKILYMGTKTHENDLNLIKSAYTKIRHEYGKRVELEIVGGIPDDVTGFAPQLKPKCIGANSDAYCDFVHWFRQTNHWDFGVIPLELTPFNRKKSYIKILDYAALGVPVICSDIEPYREIVRDGENGLLVQNDTLSWYNAMKKLIDNPELRDRLAENAFRDLTEKHLLLHRAEDFLQAISGDRLNGKRASIVNNQANGNI
ncbi:MAG: glycosyltransferase [Desulfatirhabdiaceae bacterium]